MADKKTDQTVKDDELDELLDSALEDFDKVATAKDDGALSKKSGDDDVEDPPMETLWNEEFIAQHAKIFEKQMADLFGAGDKEVTPEQMSLGFQRIAEAAAIAVDPNSSTQIPQVDPAFTQSISDLMKGLSEGQENLQHPFSGDDIAGMFGNINLNESGENNAFLPFMQGMMQSLLSAEVLLPSLREIVSKYPGWLAENGSKISTDEKERYEGQLRLMQEVCGELEKEKPDDTPEVKKDRFSIVLDRMQKMQEMGQPPSDLVGEGAENMMPGLPMDGALPSGEQCSVM